MNRLDMVRPHRRRTTTMDMESANILALAALKRLQAKAGVPNQAIQMSDSGGLQSISAYRTSGVHKTLHTAAIGVYDRWIVFLKESAPSLIRLEMRDTGVNRDQQLAVEVHSEQELNAAIDAWFDKIEWWRSRLTPSRLQPGKRYRILQSFIDHDAAPFEAGTILTFVVHHYLPYHGGHTIQFKETAIYLQDEENSPILDSFDRYFEEIR